MYRLVNVYNLFKNTNITMIYPMGRTHKLSILIIKLILASFLFVLGIISLISLKDDALALIFFALMVVVSNSYNNILLISNLYISNLKFTIAIKDLNYILIEKISYAKFKIIFYSKYNNEYESIHLYNSSPYIKETLIKYGCDVRESNEYI